MMLFNIFVLSITLSGVIPTSLSEVYVLYTDVDMEYKFHRNPLTWYDAKLKCESENAELAMPRNEAEATVLTNIFQGYTRSMLPGVALSDYVLLGFHDMFLESEFVTLKGESIQYYFHPWATGQPDNLNNEDCGSLHRSGKLNDFPCGTPGVFLCQKQGRMPRKLVYVDRCANNDTAYELAPGIGKHYKLHMNPRLWADARVICELEGGHLAIIRSKAEEEFLKELFNDPKNRVLHTHHRDYALIGFHDIYKEAHFTTVLDESLHDVGYLRWAPGQPDNAGGQEQCGSMHITGGLNDYPCGIPAVFICEKESINLLDIRFSKSK